MRGYNRQKIDLQQFAHPTRSREQIAADIAAGNPSPVQYTVRPGEKLPVNLQREVK